MVRIIAWLNLNTLDRRLRWSFFLIQLIQLIQAAGPFCFDIDGRYLVGNTACNPSARESVCCGNYWACLENGLCISTEDSPDIGAKELAIGSCTDPSWGTVECVDFCQGK